MWVRFLQARPNWKYSLVGRAGPSYGQGREFESLYFHQNLCPGGEIGRRTSLKRKKEKPSCEFESHPGYHVLR